MRVTLTSRLVLVPVLLVLALSLTVLVPAGPALAQESTTNDPIVVVTGRADVLPTTRVDGVIILDGPVLVAGTSTNDVFAANGDVSVLGRVDGDVTSLNGDVTVGGEVIGSVTATNGRARVLATGVVGGDVESSDAPQVAPLARVGGTAQQTDFASRFQAASWAVLLLWWLGVSLLTLVAGLVLLLVFRRAGNAAVATGRTAVGGSVVAGLIVGVLVPLLATLVLFTLIGIPLALSVLLGFALLLPVGYAVTAAVLGGLVVKRSPIWAFVAGWAVLRLLALVPGLGAVVWTLATLYGIGALTLAAVRAGRAPREPAVIPPAGAPAPTAASAHPATTPPSGEAQPGASSRQDVPEPRPTGDVPTETRDRDT